eukprot:scaffold5198_cov173-Amphora_coffeaeformis.AAC.9
MPKRSKSATPPQKCQASSWPSDLHSATESFALFWMMASSFSLKARRQAKREMHSTRTAEPKKKKRGRDDEKVASEKKKPSSVIHNP